MREELRSLRQFLELQIAVGGRIQPLGSERSESKDLPVPALAPTAETASRVEDDQEVATMGGGDLFGAKKESDSQDPFDRIAALIPPDSPLRGMQTLEEVERYVAETILIPLDRTRKKPVFGVGDPSASLMVVGEAPGADEDRQGEPFVGRAGQLLTKILEAIRFPRSEVYITNILKSRPPQNRDPEPEEIEAHLPILYKQMTLIRPAILLCVGRISATSLLGRTGSLGSMRGRIHDFHGIPLVVTYHPAALLRNPQWKHATWEDVQMLRARYDEQVGR